MKTVKNTTKDDYIRSVCKVILYIEQNYNEELTLEELARVGSFSKYHFHRVFKSIAGFELEPVVKYNYGSTLYHINVPFPTDDELDVFFFENTKGTYLCEFDIFRKRPKVGTFVIYVFF